MLLVYNRKSLPATPTGIKFEGGGTGLCRRFPFSPLFREPCVKGQRDRDGLTVLHLVGVDALKEAVQNVVDGKMTGTVLNDDVGQATKAAEATQLFVEGKDVEEYYWVDYVKVTTENAAQYL